MSETPVYPVTVQMPERDNYIPETYDYAARANETLASWDNGFENSTQFNLEREEPIDNSLWTVRDGQPLVAAPEYASPKSRADEVAESLEGMSDAQLRVQLDAHTAAIVHGLRKHYGLIA